MRRSNDGASVVDEGWCALRVHFFGNAIFGRTAAVMIVTMISSWDVRSCIYFPLFENRLALLEIITRDSESLTDCIRSRKRFVLV